MDPWLRQKLDPATPKEPRGTLRRTNTDTVKVARATLNVPGAKNAEASSRHSFKEAQLAADARESVFGRLQRMQSRSNASSPAPSRGKSPRDTAAGGTALSQAQIAGHQHFSGAVHKFQRTKTMQSISGEEPSRRGAKPKSRNESSKPRPRPANVAVLVWRACSVIVARVCGKNQQRLAIHQRLQRLVGGQTLHRLMRGIMQFEEFAFANLAWRPPHGALQKPGNPTESKALSSAGCWTLPSGAMIGVADAIGAMFYAMSTGGIRETEALPTFVQGYCDRFRRRLKISRYTKEDTYQKDTVRDLLRSHMRATCTNNKKGQTMMRVLHRGLFSHRQPKRELMDAATEIGMMERLFEVQLRHRQLASEAALAAQNIHAFRQLATLHGSMQSAVDEMLTEPLDSPGLRAKRLQWDSEIEREGVPVPMNAKSSRDLASSPRPGLTRLGTESYDVEDEAAEVERLTTLRDNLKKEASGRLEEVERELSEARDRKQLSSDIERLTNLQETLKKQPSGSAQLEEVERELSNARTKKQEIARRGGSAHRGNQEVSTSRNRDAAQTSLEENMEDQQPTARRHKTAPARRSLFHHPDHNYRDSDDELDEDQPRSRKSKTAGALRFDDAEAHLARFKELEWQREELKHIKDEAAAGSSVDRYEKLIDLMDQGHAKMAHLADATRHNEKLIDQYYESINEDINPGVEKYLTEGAQLGRLPKDLLDRVEKEWLAGGNDVNGWRHKADKLQAQLAEKKVESSLERDLRKALEELEGGPREGSTPPVWPSVGEAAATPSVSRHGSKEHAALLGDRPFAVAGGAAAAHAADGNSSKEGARLAAPGADPFHGSGDERRRAAVTNGPNFSGRHHGHPLMNSMMKVPMKAKAQKADLEALWPQGASDLGDKVIEKSIGFKSAAEELEHWLADPPSGMAASDVEGVLTKRVKELEKQATIFCETLDGFVTVIDCQPLPPAIMHAAMKEFEASRIFAKDTHSPTTKAGKRRPSIANHHLHDRDEPTSPRGHGHGRGHKTLRNKTDTKRDQMLAKREKSNQQLAQQEEKNADCMEHITDLRRQLYETEEGVEVAKIKFKTTCKANGIELDQENMARLGIVSIADMVAVASDDPADEKNAGLGRRVGMKAGDGQSQRLADVVKYGKAALDGSLNNAHQHGADANDPRTGQPHAFSQEEEHLHDIQATLSMAKQRLEALREDVAKLEDDKGIDHRKEKRGRKSLNVKLHGGAAGGAGGGLEKGHPMSPKKVTSHAADKRKSKKSLVMKPDVFVEKDRKELSIEPGMLGCTVDKHTGKVVHVQDDGQAKGLGITTGTELETIDGQPFSHDLLMKKQLSGEAYTVMFAKAKKRAKGPVVDSEENSDEEEPGQRKTRKHKAREEGGEDGEEEGEDASSDDEAGENGAKHAKKHKTKRASAAAGRAHKESSSGKAEEAAPWTILFPHDSEDIARQKYECCRVHKVEYKQLMIEKKRRRMKFKLMRLVKQKRIALKLKSKLLVSFLGPGMLGDAELDSLLPDADKKRAAAHQAEITHLSSRNEMLGRLLEFWRHRMEAYEEERRGKRLAFRKEVAHVLLQVLTFARQLNGDFEGESAGYSKFGTWVAFNIGEESGDREGIKSTSTSVYTEVERRAREAAKRNASVLLHLEGSDSAETGEASLGLAIRRLGGGSQLLDAKELKPLLDFHKAERRLSVDAGAQPSARIEPLGANRRGSALLEGGHRGSVVQTGAERASITGIVNGVAGLGGRQSEAGDAGIGLSHVALGAMPTRGKLRSSHRILAAARPSNLPVEESAALDFLHSMLSNLAAAVTSGSSLPGLPPGMESLSDALLLRNEKQSRQLFQHCMEQVLKLPSKQRHVVISHLLNLESTRMLALIRRSTAGNIRHAIEACKKCIEILEQDPVQLARDLLAGKPLLGTFKRGDGMEVISTEADHKKHSSDVKELPGKKSSLFTLLGVSESSSSSGSSFGSEASSDESSSRDEESSSRKGSAETTHLNANPSNLRGSLVIMANNTLSSKGTKNKNTVSFLITGEDKHKHKHSKETPRSWADLLASDGNEDNLQEHPEDDRQSSKDSNRRRSSTDGLFPKRRSSLDGQVRKGSKEIANAPPRKSSMKHKSQLKRSSALKKSVSQGDLVLKGQRASEVFSDEHDMPGPMDSVDEEKELEIAEADEDESKARFGFSEANRIEAITAGHMSLRHVIEKGKLKHRLSERIKRESHRHHRPTRHLHEIVKHQSKFLLALHKFNGWVEHLPFDSLGIAADTGRAHSTPPTSIARLCQMKGLTLNSPKASEAKMEESLGRQNSRSLANLSPVPESPRLSGSPQWPRPEQDAPDESFIQACALGRQAWQRRASKLPPFTQKHLEEWHTVRDAVKQTKAFWRSEQERRVVESLQEMGHAGSDQMRAAMGENLTLMPVQPHRKVLHELNRERLEGLAEAGADETVKEGLRSKIVRMRSQLNHALAKRRDDKSSLGRKTQALLAPLDDDDDEQTTVETTTFGSIEGRLTALAKALRRRQKAEDVAKASVEDAKSQATPQWPQLNFMAGLQAAREKAQGKVVANRAAAAVGLDRIVFAALEEEPEDEMSAAEKRRRQTMLHLTKQHEWNTVVRPMVLAPLAKERVLRRRAKLGDSGQAPWPAHLLYAYCLGISRITSFKFVGGTFQRDFGVGVKAVRVSKADIQTTRKSESADMRFRRLVAMGNRVLPPVRDSFREFSRDSLRSNRSSIRSEAGLAGPRGKEAKLSFLDTADTGKHSDEALKSKKHSTSLPSPQFVSEVSEEERKELDTDGEDTEQESDVENEAPWTSSGERRAKKATRLRGRRAAVVMNGSVCKMAIDGAETVRNRLANGGASIEEKLNAPLTVIIQTALCQDPKQLSVLLEMPPERFSAVVQNMLLELEAFYVGTGALIADESQSGEPLPANLAPEISQPEMPDPLQSSDTGEASLQASQRVHISQSAGDLLQVGGTGTASSTSLRRHAPNAGHIHSSSRKSLRTVPSAGALPKADALVEGAARGRSSQVRASLVDQRKWHRWKDSLKACDEEKPGVSLLASTLPNFEDGTSSRRGSLGSATTGGEGLLRRGSVALLPSAGSAADQLEMLPMAINAAVHRGLEPQDSAASLPLGGVGSLASDWQRATGFLDDKPPLAAHTMSATDFRHLGRGGEPDKVLSPRTVRRSQQLFSQLAPEKLAGKSPSMQSLKSIGSVDRFTEAATKDEPFQARGRRRSSQSRSQPLLQSSQALLSPKSSQTSVAAAKPMSEEEAFLDHVERWKDWRRMQADERAITANDASAERKDPPEPGRPFPFVPSMRFVDETSTKEEGPTAIEPPPKSPSLTSLAARARHAAEQHAQAANDEPGLSISGLQSNAMPNQPGKEAASSPAKRKLIPLKQPASARKPSKDVKEQKSLGQYLESFEGGDLEALLSELTRAGSKSRPGTRDRRTSGLPLDPLDLSGLPPDLASLGIGDALGVGQDSKNTVLSVWPDLSWPGATALPRKDVEATSESPRSAEKGHAPRDSSLEVDHHFTSRNSSFVAERRLSTSIGFESVRTYNWRHSYAEASDAKWSESNASTTLPSLTTTAQQVSSTTSPNRSQTADGWKQALMPTTPGRSGSSWMQSRLKTPRGEATPDTSELLVTSSMAVDTPRTVSAPTRLPAVEERNLPATMGSDALTSARKAAPLVPREPQAAKQPKAPRPGKPGEEPIRATKSMVEAAQLPLQEMGSHDVEAKPAMDKDVMKRWTTGEHRQLLPTKRKLRAL